MTYKANVADPVPASAYPVLQPVTGAPPPMPPFWECIALLHPFSPPPSDDPQPDSPFYQLCVASVVVREGVFFSAQITGCEYGTWWYVVDVKGTYLSTDKGFSWISVDIGWLWPYAGWFGEQQDNATCAGQSYLNWMEAQQVTWWKIPVPVPGSQPPVSAATWMWFDAESNAPVRMMFGQGPPTPTMGDPNQLALFQMFSFTYFPVFTPLETPPDMPGWTDPSLPSFAGGNPEGYQLFTWNEHFGMTAFMTPANESFNPLPTRILYEWKSDSDYQVYSDRAQNTLMLNTYNPAPPDATEALLTGPAPEGTTPPPFSETGFAITYAEGNVTCGPLPFPQEAPEWVSTPGVEGTIQACLTNDPVLCPNNNVMIVSVLFPPAPPNYPEATYLWTWYSPFPGSDGSHSRPVTFMQSQSAIGVGTSLALADYFYYDEFATDIDPANFEIPSACQLLQQEPPSGKQEKQEGGRAPGRLPSPER